MVFDAALQHYNLSDIELEVAGHVYDGLRTQDIAPLIFRSYQTARDIRTRIYKKMGVTSVAQFVRKVGDDMRAYEKRMLPVGVKTIV